MSNERKETMRSIDGTCCICGFVECACQAKVEIEIQQASPVALPPSISLGDDCLYEDLDDNFCMPRHTRGRILERARVRPGQVMTMAIGLIKTTVEAGRHSWVTFEYPQRIFGGDRLYLNGDGLTVVDLKVGNRSQLIHGVPASYFNIIEEPCLPAYLELREAILNTKGPRFSKIVELARRPLPTQGVKGRLVTFDTCNIGNVISLYVVNSTDRDITITGCLEGKTVS